MKITLRNTKGLFARGDPQDCPPDRLLAATNLMPKGPNLVPRPGYEDVSNSKTNVNQISLYTPLPSAGVVNTKLIIHKHLAGDHIFNNTDTPGTEIFSAHNSHHSWVNFYGRGYFTIHDTVTGDSSDKVQVYEGGASSRNACGAKPTTGLAGTSAAGGNLGVGKYLVDFAFITTSGFITKPSGSPLAVDCFGSYKIDLTSIDTGPAGTAGRIIIATKAIPLGTYTGNPNDYEFFKIPTQALIADNAATTLTISFFDGDLSDSAEYLLDLLETIPCGVGIGEYNGRMLIWGEQAGPSIVRISKPGDPESISATSGLIIVDPTESGGVTNCFDIRGTLYITKSNRIFVTRDNGGDPSTWQINQMDGGIGTECYGISKVLDSKGNSLNQVLIATRNGLYIFDGIIRPIPLTYWVEDLWATVSISNFTKIRVAINPLHKQIFVVIPTSTVTSFVLMGEYSNGMDPDNIRWFMWSSADSETSVAIQGAPSNTVTIFFGKNNTTSFINMDAIVGVDDAGGASNQPFNAVIQTPPFKTDSDGIEMYQINLAGMVQKLGQSGNITVRGISGMDATKVTPSYTIPFVTNAGVIQNEWVYTPFVDELPCLEYTIISTNKPRISRLYVEGEYYGEGGPR